MTTERAAGYLTAAAAAQYLGVSRRTFFKHVRAGVRAVQIGASVRFDIADLDKWADAHKTAPVVEQAAPVVQAVQPRRGAVREAVGLIRAQVRTAESRAPAQPPKAAGLARDRLKELRAQGKIK